MIIALYSFGDISPFLFFLETLPLLTLSFNRHRQVSHLSASDDYL